jgi:hypothetical protein
MWWFIRSMTGFPFLPELFTIQCTFNEPFEDAHVKPRLEDSLRSFDRKDDHGESESIE